MNIEEQQKHILDWLQNAYTGQDHVTILTQ